MNYFDTSAVIRAARRQQQPEGITRPHTVAEFFAIFTGRGVVFQSAGQTVKLALSPADTMAVARQTFSRLKFVELDGAEVFAALENTIKKNITGKSIHDFIHAAAAEKAGCKGIVTMNEKDFRRMTSLKIFAPSE